MHFLYYTIMYVIFVMHVQVINIFIINMSTYIAVSRAPRIGAIIRRSARHRGPYFTHIRQLSMPGHIIL